MIQVIENSIRALHIKSEKKTISLSAIFFLWPQLSQNFAFTIPHCISSNEYLFGFVLSRNAYLASGINKVSGSIIK